MFEEVESIDCALVLDFLQHNVDDDVGPCLTHSSTVTQHTDREEEQQEWGK